MDLSAFRQELKAYLLEQLQGYQPKCEGIPMRAFDLGIFPWFGYVELSFATQQEVLTQSEAHLENAGDWSHYCFNQLSEQGDEHPMKVAAKWMQDVYSQGPGRSHEQFFRLGAAVLRDPEVAAELGKYQQSTDFECSVRNPDEASGINYYQETEV